MEDVRKIRIKTIADINYSVKISLFKKSESNFTVLHFRQFKSFG